MQFRGGSVGHTFMRVLETWLAGTGWDSDITPDVAIPQDDPEPPTAQSQAAEEESDEGREDMDNEGSEVEEGDKDKEAYEDEESGGGEGDKDEDKLFMDEETLEGKYGFTRF